MAHDPAHTGPKPRFNEALWAILGSAVISIIAATAFVGNPFNALRLAYLDYSHTPAGGAADASPVNAPETLSNIVPPTPAAGGQAATNAAAPQAVQAGPGKPAAPAPQPAPMPATAPAQTAPVQTTPAQTAPVQTTPAQTAPVQTTPGQNAVAPQPPAPAPPAAAEGGAPGPAQK